MKFHSLLTEDLVLLDLKSGSREKVLKEMVDHLKAKNKISKKSDLYEMLIQREKLGTTAIGEGVAIPHCKLKGVKAPLFLLGASKPGVNFNSLDGKPSHIFFVVISSPDNPGMNIQALAAIAKLVRKATGLAGRLLEAKSPKAAIKIVREEEEKANV
jgi:mannitol/fructose-specific phosphotransferase system IIA component (Ntr-type)